MGQYPAVVTAFGSQNSAINNASSILTTTNENNASVAVGYARPQSTLVSWLLIVEQSHHEAWEPTYKLRNIVLACVFGTIGLILIIVLPLAHFSVRPIRRLRDATEKSIAPPGYTPNGSIRSGRLDGIGDISGDEENAASESQREKKGLFVRLRRLAPGMKRKSKTERTEDERRRVNNPPFTFNGLVPRSSFALVISRCLGSYFKAWKLILCRLSRSLAKYKTENIS
jgi:osomolarity two-component system, sensor histidine kinase SLN1